jgi:Protein of unknown function (DUF2804)
MRTLEPAPSSAIDPSTGALRFGSYRGSIRGVDLSRVERNPLVRIAREKRWLYAALATDELFAAAAVVRLGYSATAFAYVYDARERRIVAHESSLGPTTACRVFDDPSDGVTAHFSLGRNRFRLEKTSDGSLVIDVRTGVIAIEAALDAALAPPSITAVAKIPDGVVDVTEKRSLLAARGAVRVGDRRYALEGGRGGFDLTQGLLGRRTQWKWAYAMGRCDDGAPFAMNLVQGFVGAPECAVWIGDELIGVGEGRITPDASDARAPWSVTTECGAVDLRFVAQDFHRENRDLVVVSSRFVQAVGAFEGTVRTADGRTHTVRDALGVTEQQDTRW